VRFVALGVRAASSAVGGQQMWERKDRFMVECRKREDQYS
jgi:hypothetical protein